MGKLHQASVFAPIVVFGYRRPDKLRKCLEALARCEEAKFSDVTIYVDGPESEEVEDEVTETVEVAHRSKGFLSKRVVWRPDNLGLSKSVISGVSEALQVSESVIVLEDDLEVSEGFLRFMNDGLKTYRDCPEVVSIHGYCYPVPEALTETFFLRGADCWGWATWRRGWSCFEPDGKKLLRNLRESGELDDFDFGGAGGFLDMLRDQISGTNDSWAVRWYASAFLARKLTLYPWKSLVVNSGLDGGGTHGSANRALTINKMAARVEVNWQQPSESVVARASFERFFRSIRSRSESCPTNSIFRWFVRQTTRKRRGWA